MENYLQNKEVILSVKDLSVCFSLRGKSLHAIRGVSLDVYKGESLAIVGESGSGKSVLTKNFIGLLDKNGTIDKGEILFEGMDLAKFKTEREWAKIRGKKIAMVMQDPMTSLNPLKTIGWQISEALILNRGMNHAQAKAETLNILKDVGISEPERRYKQYPHEFSGGQRQRVGIARALAVNPEFIVCDEPVSALDVSIQAQVVNMFEDLQKDLNLTYLFIAHDLSVVRHISNRIGVMYLGKLVELADSYELISHSVHPYTKSLISAIPEADPIAARASKRIPLQGDVPSPLNPPSGCRFRTRCPYADEKCAEVCPEFKEVSPGHYAACHHLDKVN